MTSALTPLKSDRFGLAQSGTALHLRRQGTRLPRRHVSSWQRAPKARVSRGGRFHPESCRPARNSGPSQRGTCMRETGDREFSASLARRRGSGFWSRFLSPISCGGHGIRHGLRQTEHPPRPWLPRLCNKDRNSSGSAVLVFGVRPICRNSELPESRPFSLILYLAHAHRFHHRLIPDLDIRIGT